MLFLFIILGILLVFTAFIFFPMQFGVHHVRTAKKNQLYIYASLFGVLIRIPIRTSSKTPTPSNKEITRTTDKKNILTFESFQKNVDILGDVIKVSKSELTEMLSYVRKHLTCKEMDMRIAFGTGNAAKTGITNGAVWTTGTMLLKLIDTLIGIKKIHMDVYPDFQQKRFEISFKTILVMKPIHFLIIYKRVRKTIQYIKTQISNFN